MKITTDSEGQRYVVINQTGIAYAMSGGHWALAIGNDSGNWAVSMDNAWLTTDEVRFYAFAHR